MARPRPILLAKCAGLRETAHKYRDEDYIVDSQSISNAVNVTNATHASGLATTRTSVSPISAYFFLDALFSHSVSLAPDIVIKFSALPWNIFC